MWFIISFLVSRHPITSLWLGAFTSTNLFLSLVLNFLMSLEVSVVVTTSSLDENTTRTGAVTCSANSIVLKGSFVPNPISFITPSGALTRKLTARNPALKIVQNGAANTSEQTSLRDVWDFIGFVENLKMWDTRVKACNLRVDGLWRVATEDATVLFGAPTFSCTDGFCSVSIEWRHENGRFAAGEEWSCADEGGVRCIRYKISARRPLCCGANAAEMFDKSPLALN